MKPSKQCIDLIRSHEGLRPVAYPDPGSVDGRPWTIGWGTTVYRNAGVAKYGRSSVSKGDTLTEQECEQEFQAAVNYFAKVINGATNKLNQGQFDAAVSFAYNTGANTRQITRLQSGALADFRRMMLQYTKGGDGRVMPGLVKRRESEAKLWDSGKAAKDLPPANWIALVRHGSKAAPDLRAYLMDNDVCIGLKRFASSPELIAILQQSPGASVSIGEYGWHAEPVEARPSEKYGIATLKRTGKKRGNGLEILALEFNGELFECVSGQPNAQYFRKPEHPRSVPGCMEPIPEGNYRIGDIEWASGKDNYNASWGPGLGPVWIALPATFKDDRSAFGIHLDSNAGTSPGSAGCVVIPNESELKRLVAALRKHDPKTLRVEWN
jgi:lysozyme